MGRKGKRFRAEVDVRFHHEDVLKKSKVQLSGSEGDVNTSGGGDLPSDCPPACVGADPPDLDSADEGAAEFTTRHYQRLQKAEDSWSKLREAMLMTTFQAHGSFSGKNCFFCNSVANCRCLDCGPFMSLCESCAVDNHTNRNIFHHVEIFTDSKLYFPLKMQRVLICKDHQCSNGVHFRPVMIADTRGLQKEVHVQFCGCEPDFLRLLRFRLWGATPSKPELAFSINVMDLLHTLNLECQVAVKDFCDALQTMADDVIVFSNQRKLYPVIIDSLEEYRLYHHKLATLNFAVNCSGLDDGTVCPACPKSEGTLLESMDALFIGRKKTAGKSVRSPLFGDILFANDDKVDKFVEQHPTRSGEGANVACADFLAGSTLRSKSRYAALSETAIFGRACRHEFPKRFLNMKHGERLAYPVFILNDLLDEFDKTPGIAVHMLYDIACLLESHLQAQGQLQILEHIKFAIPIFHCYGHKSDCQIKYSPRRLPGFALTDGEVLERLWSFLRRFGKMTKEMRPNHRVDVLTDALLFYAKKRSASLGRLLYDRMKKANTAIKNSEVELATLLDTLEVSVKREEVAKWANEEAGVTGLLESPVEPPSWKHGYIIYLKMFYEIHDKWQQATDPVKLQQLHRKMNKLEEMLCQIEQKNGVAQRWQTSDESFQRARNEANDKQKKALLCKVKTRVVERWFLLGLKAKYAEGHTLAKRLSKQITKATKFLKSSIQDYNNLEYSNSCSLPLTITFDAVKDPDSDVWMEAHASGESATAVPVSIRRKAIDLYHLRNRCQEEISLLQSEMENTLEHFIQQHQLLLSTLDDGSDNGSFEGRGRDIFVRGKILSLESYIVHLKVLFEGYIENVSSPSLIFQNDLPSLDQQANMSTESAGIHEETPCLISLPEIETGTFDGSDSDSEDDDDEYEDYNISLLTLDL